jgi:lysozyme family protein
MMTRFHRAIPIILKHEGGYVDHPKDPGGATNFGITHLTLAAWRGRAVTKQDVRQLSKQEAEDIYRARFWQPISADRMTPGVDLVTFDAAVNSGPGRGVRWTQRAVGVEQDGRVGPVTLAAINSTPAATVIKRATDYRLSFMQSLRIWSTFGRGWARRVGEIRATALLWAAEAPALVRADAEEQRTKATKENGAAAASGAGGAGTAVVEPSLALVFVALVLLALTVWLVTRARTHSALAEGMEAVLEENPS